VKKGSRCLERGGLQPGGGVASGGVEEKARYNRIARSLLLLCGAKTSENGVQTY